jgi:putative effector of murein hydrolase
MQAGRSAHGLGTAKAARRRDDGVDERMAFALSKSLDVGMSVL